MSLLNIPSSVDDPNYRYRMPKLLAKVEGRGNGIKTNVVNMAEIAAALKRPTAYPLKFFGNELGAQSSYSEKDQKAIVNGAHEQKILQELVDKFIEKFVLCESCHLPEVDLYLKGKNKDVVCGKCNACGWDGILDNTHKLCTFIKNNPPGGNTTMESRKSKDKKKKEKTEGGSDGEDKKKEKKEKKDKKDKKDKSEKKKKRDKCDGEERGLVGLESDEYVIAQEALREMWVQKKAETAMTPQDLSIEINRHRNAIGFDHQVGMLILFHTILGDAPSLDMFLLHIKWIKKMLDSSPSTHDVLCGMEFYMFSESEIPLVDRSQIFQQMVAKLCQEDLLHDGELLSHYYLDPSDDATTLRETAYAHALAAVSPVLDWIRSSQEGSSSSSSDESIEDDNSRVKSLGKIASKNAETAETPVEAPPVVVAVATAEDLSDLDIENI